MRKVPTAFGSACVAVVIAGMLALATGLAGHPIRAAGDDIGGVVTGPNGAEAGVWVIALGTRLWAGRLRRPLGERPCRS